jgi:hypothetical protein
MQLVRALGAAVEPAYLDQQLCPADVLVFCQVCEEYIEQFETLDPVFEFVAGWLKAPAWVAAWGYNRLEPGSRPEDLVKALHNTIRQMSGKHDPEASFNLRSGRGLGFSVCCFNLGVAEKFDGADATEDELVHDIGKMKITWRLRKVVSPTNK